MSNREKILACLTEPKSINNVALHIGANYHTIKNLLVAMKMEGILNAYKDSDNRLMHYYIPQPHPLQDIFGHTMNFTDAQIKSITIHNASTARHNLQQNTPQELFGESVAYTITRYD